jgi:hypothetical protein
VVVVVLVVLMSMIKLSSNFNSHAECSTLLFGDGVKRDNILN